MMRSIQFLKFVIICSLVLLGDNFVLAQWIQSNTASTTDPIYRTGNVGIGASSSPNTKLFVSGSTGSHGISASFRSNLIGGQSSAIVGINASVYGTVKGVEGFSIQPSGFQKEAYGVLGTAGSAPDNYNYGVMGKIIGNNKGAGVVGYDQVSFPNWNFNTEGSWAGYFRGSVHVSERLGVGVITPSEKLHVGGNFATPWGFTWYHEQAGFSPLFKKLPWLKKSWNTTLFDYMYLGATGNIASSTQGAMIFSNSQKIINFGLGHNNADQLSSNFMSIDGSGKVLIGDPSLDVSANGYKLFVEDGILTEEVKVAIRGSQEWQDYVFEEDYELNPLEAVEDFIKKEGHLPNVPSAKEIVEDGGFGLKAMTVNQQGKIEEIFLHLIEMNKEINVLKAENQRLQVALNIK